MESVHTAWYRADVTSPLHSFLNGSLCHQVFIYKTHGSFNRSFFESPDTWLPVSNKERRYHEPNHCLKEVMEYFLMADPVAKVRFTLLLTCC